MFWVLFSIPCIIYFIHVPELARMRWTAVPRWSFAMHPLFDAAWMSALAGVVLGTLGRRIRRVVLRRRFMRGE